MKASRGRPRAQSRDDVRDVARGLFAEHGYEQTSLAAIAEAAGIGRTTLFSYFPAKSDLMWEELEASHERLRATLASASPRDSVPAILEEAMVASSDFSPADHDALRYRWRIVEQSPQLNADLHTRMGDQREMLTAFLLTRVRDDSANIAGVVAAALTAASHAASRQWALSNTPERSMAEITRETVRMLLVGYRDCWRPAAHP